jgi:hypothetical protein
LRVASSSSAFYAKEPLIEHKRILAVEGDHLGPRLATSRDFEGVGLYSFHDRGRNIDRGLTSETEIRTRLRTCHQPKRFSSNLIS